MTPSDYYKTVYARDNPMGDAHGWIQWKGTEVCMDVYCKCGHHGHVDASFFYNYKCPACGTRYAVGQVVKMIELTDTEAQHAGGFHTDTHTD